jgi:hypothetical protein
MEPKKGQRNSGKNLPFHLRTNPGWLQNIPTDQSAHGHNPRTRQLCASLQKPPAHRHERGSGIAR